MFVGHLALALAAKRSEPRAQLAWYVTATTALDLVWPLFLFLGIEQVRVAPGATAFNPLVFVSYPWSHSLLMAAVWGAVLTGIGRWRGLPPRAVGLLFLLVVSHWLLDAASHAPDMPLWPGNSPLVGLGLWYSVPGTLVVEGLIWLAGIVLYLRPRQATGVAGPLAFWSLVAVCTLMWALGPWSPPPPSASALARFAMLGWLILPWAWAADRGYMLRPGANA